MGIYDIKSWDEMITCQHGFRTMGKITYFILENFKQGETESDKNEIQEIITLPIKGLFRELLKKHTVTADTLLAAKLLEEKFMGL